MKQNLDTLLQDWADRHALSPLQSETIRKAIVLTSETDATELTVGWWQQVFGSLTTALQQSTDMNRYLPASIR